MHDADLIFGLDWFAGSSVRRTNMVVCNTADCSANMELAEHLNMLPSNTCHCLNETERLL